MAVLSEPDRILCRHDLTTDPNTGTLVGLTKADVKAAVDAADVWVSTNAAAFNSALPLAFRTNTTAAQKSQLLNYVVRKRYTSGAQ